MQKHMMRVAGSMRKPFLAVLAVLLVMGMTALPLQARESEANQWPNNIDVLLADGDYTEGEAIVALAGEDDALSAQADYAYDVEPLMEVGASSLGAEASGALTAQGEGHVTLVLVTSSELSTADLLYALAEDPRVVFAEPNYISVLDDGYEETVYDEAAYEGATSQYGLVAQADALMDDLTPLQWSSWAGDNVARTTDSAPNPSINVPAFGSSEVGANMDEQVVVALIDAPADYTNADLANVIYRFTPEQQKALVCGEWGYNTLGEYTNGVPEPPSSVSGHGTHVAGIIGASWDGHGVSGVASNVKIISIQNGGTHFGGSADGKTSLSNILRGYAFVDRCNDAGIGVRVINCSWGLRQSSRSADAAVRELGDKWGIVTVFAAGNSSKDNDLAQMSPSIVVDNPYAVVVANTSPTEELGESSEYGVGTVDIATPGTLILSTVRGMDSIYIPDATRSTGILYEGFESDGGQFTLTQLDKDGNEIGAPFTVTQEAHLFGTGSARIELDTTATVGTVPSVKASQLYDVRIDIPVTEGQVTSIADVANLYFGVAIASQGNTVACVNSIRTNVAKDEGTFIQPLEFSLSEKGAWTSIPFDLTTQRSDDLSEVAASCVLSITMRIQASDNCNVVWLDSLGMGTQKAPYDFRSGTSMAAPAMTGAVAVLASQGYEGEELATLARSKVRIPETPLPVRTGGIFDFTVAGSVDVPSDDAVAPDIAAVVVDGQTVTITGSNFSTKPGSFQLSRYVVGKDLQDVAASLVSWRDDEVVLSLEGPFAGILRCVVTNPGGKYDTRQVFVSKGESVYEQDLDLDTSTGEPFVLDELGDWEPKGPLVGLGCKLYYLPALQKVENDPAYQRMLCYDLKKKEWSELPGLPEPLAYVSAVMHDGKIVAEGATMALLESGEPTTVFPDGQSAEERVYVYDPATGAWAQASSEGMILGQTIVNDGGQLMLVGGAVEDPTLPPPLRPYALKPAPVMTYDLTKGVVESVCEHSEVYKNPSAAAKDGTIVLYDALSLKVVRIQDGNASVLEGALPAFALAKDKDERDQILTGDDYWVGRGVVVPVSEGFILVGPPAADGSSDTYLLRDGEDSFVPYEKRSSDARVFSQAACSYRGRLFVIGSSWFEPDLRLFRATAIDVPEYPGDIPCDEDPEPTPTPTPTPDPTPTPTPDPTPEPKPTPKPTPTPLPKTGDMPLGDIAVPIACAGLMLLAFGWRIRNTKG